MANLIASTNPLVLTLVILVSSALLTVFLGFLIKRNLRLYKKDKYTQIKDMATLKELLRLIDYRISSIKNDLFFTLLLVSIDDYDRITEIISESGAKDYLAKVIESIRKALPIGAKMAQTEEKETFLIYLPEFYSNESMEKVVQVFKNSAESTVMINNSAPMQKTASVSVTVYPAQGDNVIKLINNLLAGLYSIKKTGGNAVSYYNVEMDNKEDYADRYKDIKQAIDIGNMKIRFNPLMNPETEKLMGIESRINRINDNGTSTEYGRLLKYLEESDDDFWFTVWGVEKSLLLNLDILHTGKGNDFIVALKAGYKFMINNDSAYKLQTSLERYNISPNNVVLELDEVLENESGNRYVKNILQMQGTGIRIIANITKTDIDLNRLIEVYDVDLIKINVKEVIRKNTFVETLLKTAYNYRKKVIVVGVETKEQVEQLKKKHISYIQGPYFGMLLTKEQLNNME